MTLTIQLNAMEEARRCEAARERGLAPDDLARRLIAELRVAPKEHNGETSSVGADGRDPARVAHVQSIRGKCADIGATTADLHRERQSGSAR